VAGLAVAVIVVGAAVVHHTTNGRIGVMRGFGAPGMMSDGPRHSFRSGFTSNNESRLEGVVTKVDGSTITIAGGGKTNTLTVSSSTQYSGGSSAAVNDTVVATGTTNNGTFTATSVLVNP
jgi:hypothetical protein